MSEHSAEHAEHGGGGASMTTMDMGKLIFNLLVIYLVGGLIIASVYAKTSPIIFKNRKEMREKALKAMMPEAEAIEKMGDWYPHGKHVEYLEAKAGGEIVGYIVETLGKGYSSYINTLVALDKDLVIQKIDILSHQETPGLGDEILVPAWKAQFNGKTLNQIKLVKTDTTEYIQAISGATISSRAVTDDGGGGGVYGGVKMLTDALAGHPPAQPEGGH